MANVCLFMFGALDKYLGFSVTKHEKENLAIFATQSSGSFATTYSSPLVAARVLGRSQTIQWLDRLLLSQKIEHGLSVSGKDGRTAVHLVTSKSKQHFCQLLRETFIHKNRHVPLKRNQTNKEKFLHPITKISKEKKNPFYLDSAATFLSSSPFCSRKLVIQTLEAYQFPRITFCISFEVIPRVEGKTWGLIVLLLH